MGRDVDTRRRPDVAVEEPVGQSEPEIHPVGFQHPIPTVDPPLGVLDVIVPKPLVDGGQGGPVFKDDAPVLNQVHRPQAIGQAVVVVQP